MTDRFEAHLRDAEPEFRELLGRIPLLATPPLPGDWLRWEMLERHEVLSRAPIRAGTTILEVGSGPHAIATVPLAYAAGPSARVVAVERSRWDHFRTVVGRSGLGDRIGPVRGDARRLPLSGDSVSLAVCLHGIRSLHGEEGTVRVIREMFRVAPYVFLAESLPLARNGAQRAHLAMYDLREEVFSAAGGGCDDLHYAPLDRLVALVKRAGGVVERSEVLEVDLPHFLAYFPRARVEAVPAGEHREDLLRRWDEADVLRRRDGEDHPPVGVVTASRAQ